MKRTASILLTLLMVITLLFSNMTTITQAASTTASASCLVRIEGLNGTIAKGYGTGNTASEAAIDVLNQNKIEYSGDKNYISEIDNIASGSIQHGYDGWMYYVKHADGKTVDTPYPYIPANGDEIVFYYGNKDMDTPFLNSLEFSPKVVQPNKDFTMTFSWKHDAYDANWNPIPVNTPIVGANVIIDNKNYVTDKNGDILVEGLKYGSHTYKISGYNKNLPPSVVMDEGSFNIDGKTVPGFSYKDSSYSNTADNNGIFTDVDKEISDTSNALSKLSDPWLAVDMQKLGLNSNKQFVSDIANNINNNGIKSLSNTELEKAIIALTAASYTPYNFMGQDLVQELFNRNINDFQINDLIFGLCAYNYANISDNKYKITIDDLKNSIVNKKISSTGGWAFVGNTADPDITGMTLYALAPYYNSDNSVKSSVDSAVQYLSNIEDISGYIPSSNGKTSETLSMVILGLTSIGVDPGQGSFAKFNGNLIKALISFKGTEGNYKHTLNDDSLGNALSTEEVLRALIALKNFNNYGTYNFYSSNIDASKLSIYYSGKQNNCDTNDDPSNSISQPSELLNDVASKQSVQTIPSQSSQVSAVKTTSSKEVANASTDSSETSSSEANKSNSQNQDEKLVNNSASTLVSTDNLITVSLPDGVIDIPSGSNLYFSEKDISNSEKEKVNSRIPHTLKLIGNAFSLNLELKDKNGIVSEIHKFKSGKTVKVCIKLNNYKNLNTSKLKAYYFDENSLEWKLVEGENGKFDSSKGTFTFETPHFTTFAIMEETAYSTKAISNLKGGFFDVKIVICILLIIIALVSSAVIVLRGKSKGKQE